MKRNENRGTSKKLNRKIKKEPHLYFNKLGKIYSNIINYFNKFSKNESKLQ